MADVDQVTGGSVEHKPDGDERETDEDAVSGMPEGEPELRPMGVDPSTDGEDASGEPPLPGFPTEGEPDVSG